MWIIDLITITIRLFKDLPIISSREVAILLQEWAKMVKISWIIIDLKLYRLIIRFQNLTLSLEYKALK